jgi:hypothetical protein
MKLGFPCLPRRAFSYCLEDNFSLSHDWNSLLQQINNSVLSHDYYIDTQMTNFLLLEIWSHLIHIFIHIEQSIQLFFALGMIFGGCSDSLVINLKNLEIVVSPYFVIMIPQCRGIDIVLSAKYTLVNATTSLYLNYSAMHPSTLPLLPTIELSFFNALSI